MKNQNYATLTLSNEDLKLIQQSLNALSLERINLGLDENQNVNRLYHAISMVIDNDTCTSNSESALMNS